MADGPSTTASQYAPSEMAHSVAGEASPAREPTTFPPYPPYATEPAPPSVAGTIIAGRDLRLQYKSLPRQLVHPPPKPARPKGPKATDVKLSRRAARAHARCLRRHGAVLTDRLEHMSKPPRRAIINMWREHADTLPAETISRLRTMLDADEPFKPDQAYEYFINLRKSKKKNTALRVNQIKKDVLAMCGDKRFMWARNATVAFARGIQQRLSKPGRFSLADGMLRLSNIILNEICSYMSMRMPSRRCTHPKAKFMMDIADKIAVWIDEILSESDDRMLMMDFDEDEDLFKEFGDAGFTDDFLNMMGDGGLFKGPQPAYLKFTGEMLEAFMILTESMEKKGDEQLLSHGKFNQTYAEGADELKRTPDFDASEFDTALAEKLNKDLTALVKPNTPTNIAPFMKDVVEICADYLAQNAEYNKDKGPAFKLLIQAMRSRSSVVLFQKEKLRKTYGKAATDLEEAKGLEIDHDEPNLSQEIHSNLSQLVESTTPNELKDDMAETLDIASKYLSQHAIDELERGPAFDVLIHELDVHGADPYTPQFTPLGMKYAAAYVLKTAPGLSSVTPDEATAPTFVEALHRAADAGTPKALQKDMDEVIQRCGNYQSAYVRDRDKAMQILLKTMKSNAPKELLKRNNYSLDYGTAATETEAAPIVVPFLPIKDIATEGRDKLNKDVENTTPVELKTAMKSVVQDVSRYLSQGVALRSGAAGGRYPLNFLSAITKSLGSRPLFKHKAYGQTYSDAADVLKYAGPLESDPKCEKLQYEIMNEMKRGVPPKLAPTIASGLDEISVDAAKHLAKVGTHKGEALDYLVGAMKQKGLSTLGQMQGYQQTYNDGARRIENSPTLVNEKIDKGVYENVRGKLTKLITEKPSPEHEKLLPELVDESSKFLSAPLPETDAEKRRVLADLMSRKGDQILGEDKLYKMTFTEAGDEIMSAPVSVVASTDPAKTKEMHSKITAAIPDKKMQELLKDPANEGAAHLTDVIHGRGEALQIIHDDMQAKQSKDFLTIGKFKKTHADAAVMITEASKFGGLHPSPVIFDKVKQRIDELPKTGGSDAANKEMDDTTSIVSAYIAGVATDECGLDAKALAALDGKGKSASALNVGDEEEERLRREAEEAERRKREEEERKKREAEEKNKMNEDEERRRREEEERKRLEDERKRREKEESDKLAEERRRREEEAKRSKETADKSKHGKLARPSAADLDREREQALSILHTQLRARGKEMLYKQPHTQLTHSQASDWVAMKPPMKVDKSVKESADTSRLHKKFERKLSSLVAKVTPADMYDTMQDVVIESSRIVSEYFVSSNYKALVREALISEMQRRGNEILIEVDGAAETFFFSAQRLKKAKSMEVKEPCSQVAYYLNKRLDDMIRCRSMARKLTATMKDHVKDASDYLSELVTKPDDQIEAYVSLLGEMESAGDALLIEGNIPKSYKDAAAYLRQLTSLEDQIGRANSALQASTEAKLKGIMANVTATGYSVPVMNVVITDSTRLLVSYIMLQGEKTEALKIMIEKMEQTGECVLLRHGNLRKSYVEGANRLRGKNTDQLSVPSADPVVARKIQIKLNNLMRDCTPPNYQALIDDVIEDATMYLAVHFLQPHIIKVCKCMKNVFVQCELWCDEILRRVARPCCTCSRHISAQALQDLAPGQQLRISPGSSRAFAPGIEISLTECPARPTKTPRRGEKPSTQPCPAAKPTEGCRQATTSYLMYSTAYSMQSRFEPNPTRLLPESPSGSLETPDTPSPSTSPSRTRTLTQYPSTSLKPSFYCTHEHNVQIIQREKDVSTSQSTTKPIISGTSSPGSFHTPPCSTNSSMADSAKTPFWQNPTTMYANYSRDTNRHTSRADAISTKTTRLKSGYSTRAPIISTDQMSDWHAMMVSLMWNVQAWRDWIQENIDRALAFQQTVSEPNVDVQDSWTTFQRRVAAEALQWRQYNTFSRQLTLRLVLRYQDKQIVSPTRATVKTQAYMECQREMLDIIDMFNRWTQWLTLVVKESDSLQEDPKSDVSLQEMRWRYFKTKIDEYAEDWNKYNQHLKVYWEHKYRSLIADWLPAWKQSGPVWVVSAYGAVPSGAVAAGVFDGEVVWVARTTHKCNVLPAALHPSKHSCLVYADGAVHHYTKYQVMCNAEVRWVAWRSGAVGARAVRAARGVHVGRVLYRGSHLVGAVLAPHYRCHVIIFSRPFAFNCYELLVLADD